jgi:hypothetical protein
MRSVARNGESGLFTPAFTAFAPEFADEFPEFPEFAPAFAPLWLLAALLLFSFFCVSCCEIEGTDEPESSSNRPSPGRAGCVSICTFVPAAASVLVLLY